MLGYDIPTGTRWICHPESQNSKTEQIFVFECTAIVINVQINAKVDFLAVVVAVFVGSQRICAELR